MLAQESLRNKPKTGRCCVFHQKEITVSTDPSASPTNIYERQVLLGHRSVGTNVYCDCPGDPHLDICTFVHKSIYLSTYLSTYVFVYLI